MKLKHIIPSPDVMMGNIKIKQPLPTSELESLDPFLLLHHAEPKEIPAGGKGMNVPPHPHRGFSPVSFVFNGQIGHRDSLGNETVVKDFGVQWINAGSGLLHAEGITKEFQKTGGTFQMIQLWVNSLISHKMANPYYKGLGSEEMPKQRLSNGGFVQVVSGLHDGLKGPFEATSDVNLLMANMKAGEKTTIDVPMGHNSFVMVLTGAFHVVDAAIGKSTLCVLDGYGKAEVTCEEDGFLLIGTGEPLNEPVATHGPFVMSTQRELMEAINDYNAGKMGTLD